jgi:hypothetical protein
MNMITQLKSKNVIIYIIILLVILLIIPQNSYAYYRADHPPETNKVACKDKCDDGNNILSVKGIVGGLYGAAKTKAFNMVRSDDGKNLNNTGSSVPQGSTLTYTRYDNNDDSKKAKGEWHFEGGTYDSPDMDGQWREYNIRKEETYQECTCEKYKCTKRKEKCTKQKCEDECTERSKTECEKYKCEEKKNSSNKTVEIKVDPPSNNNPEKVEGSGAVTCNNNTRVCTATGLGNASIKLTFPKVTATIKAKLKGENRAEDTSEFKFNEVEFTYNFTVYDPNRPPVVSSCGASNVSYNDGRITWNYTDPDGDSQREAHIQVSTTSNFTNPVVNTVRYDNRTTLDIDGLIHGTRYYFQVKVNDGKVDSVWKNCGSFNTPPNNPPNLDRLSCSATSGETDYERARLTWDYTGTDEPDDQLVVKARYKRNPEDTIWTTLNLPNNAQGARNINDLISGFKYQVQISLNDNRNSHLGDRWKGCGNVTPPNYPVPTLEQFNISGGNPVRITQYTDNPKRLTLKTGDRVSTNWNIKDSVGLQSCSLSTSGGGNLPSSVPGQLGEEDFRNSLSEIGFNRNINNKTVPTITEDSTYNVNLNCTGRPAKTIRTIDQTINLKVESWPRITSCSIDGNSTVQEGQTSINIKATIGNVNSYTWKIGKFSTDNNPITGGPSTNLNLSQTLDYTGLAFGKYRPWVEVARSDNTSRTDKKDCTGSVSNLGSSNIKEVN